VRVTAWGDLPKELGKEIITKARKRAAKANYSILCDVSRASLQVALADWFYLPRRLEVLREKPTRDVKVALVVSTESKEDYKFYQNVATNVGLTLGVFLTEEQALAWLT